MAKIISQDAMAHMRMFTPQTYGINLPRDIADELIEAKLIEWLPPTGWSGTIYGLTEEGRKTLKLDNSAT